MTIYFVQSNKYICYRSGVYVWSAFIVLPCTFLSKSEGVEAFTHTEAAIYSDCQGNVEPGSSGQLDGYGDKQVWVMNMRLFNVICLGQPQS